MSHRTPRLLLLVSFLAACQAPAAVTWVADVHAAAQRFWNRQIVVEGQVTRVEADPVGTTRGRYLLVDESDAGGILVVSRELPAPGAMLRVEGQVVQDPRNAVRPMLRELGRGAPAGARWRYMVLGGVAAALLLIIALAWYLLRPEQAEAVGERRDTRSGQPSDVTKEYRPAPDAGITVPFEYWGVELAVVEGPDAGKVFPIGVSPLHIGRSGRNGQGRKNHVILSDSTVSREHATLSRNKHSGAFSVTNDSERNPTVVDGREIEATEIQPGARLRMGATLLEFRRASN